MNQEQRLDDLWAAITKADEHLVDAERALRNLQGTERAVEDARLARRRALVAYVIESATGERDQDPEKALIAYAIENELARRGGRRRAA